MKKPISILAAVLPVVWSCSLNGPDIAGTSEQGNARVLATLYTTGGEPAAGATVRLRRADYVKAVSLSKQTTAVSADAVTGSDGSFAIDSIDTGSYVIEVTDNTEAAVLLRCRIDAAGTVRLPADTLRPYSIVKGRTASAGTGQFVQVEGLERLAEVADDGSYSLTDLPAGNLTIRTVSIDSSNDPVVIPDIITRPAQTTLVPYNGWLFSKPVFLNTTSSGAGVAADLYGFPVVIRLDADNFAFDETNDDGSDLRVIKQDADSTPLAFEIERWDPVAGIAEVWVRLDTVYGNSSDRSFVMLWGNPAAEAMIPERPVFDTADGFGGVWHLSGEGDGQVRDATPNGYHGVPAAVDAAEGIIGESGAFDSDEQSHITIPNTASGTLNFPENGTFTVSVWVTSDSVDYNRVIIGKGDVQYYLRIHNDNWHFASYRDLPLTEWSFTASPYSFGEWVHLCGVRNDTSQYLYVNGVCVDSVKKRMGGDEPRNESFDVEIGRRVLPDGTDGLYFSGSIDEVRIDAAARDSAWIKLSYMNQQSDDRLITFKK